ncbi:MAG: DUF4097 family beta strand repeat-containing protein [Pseudohongiellaceae bacterium]
MTGKQLMAKIPGWWAALLVLAVQSGTLLAASSDDIDQEFTVAAGGTLTVNSDSGPIEVRSWERNVVRVRIRNRGSFEVDVAQEGNDVVVIADQEGGLFGFGGSNIRFDIDVPRQYNVDLETGGGSIDVGDLAGDVHADTSGGSISIGRVTGGDVVVDTSGGRISIADVDGNVSADTSGGSISIANVTGNVEADTSGGSIRTAAGGDIYADTSGGNIEVGEGAGRVELDTSGGTIRAGWAMGPLIADTSGGNIFLEGSETSVEADTSGGNIEIRRSNGPVYADTSGGSITIRQSRGPIRADTAGGRVEAELLAFSGERDATVELESSGGDVIVRIPADHGARIVADLEVSRRSRGDYRIYTDFPITIQEDGNGNILAVDKRRRQTHSWKPRTAISTFWPSTDQTVGYQSGNRQGFLYWQPGHYFRNSCSALTRHLVSECCFYEKGKDKVADRRN